jgi:hypothetical protein
MGGEAQNANQDEYVRVVFELPKDDDGMATSGFGAPVGSAAR